MNREELLSATDEQILDEVQRIQYLFGHSKIIRHGLNRDDEQYVTQSVSEHIYNMMVLAEYFWPLEDPDNAWDWQKIQRMILWHDAVELEVGDVKTHEKNEEAYGAKENAIPIVISKVPSQIQKIFRDILHEYEQRESQESLFVKALDVLEVEIAGYTPEGKERLIGGVQADWDIMQFYKKKQHNHAQGFPCILRFVDLVMERLIEEKYYKES